MPYHCSYGTCKSDSRYPKYGVSFVRFPDPEKHYKLAKRWAHLCGRKNFTVKNVTRHTYVCSDHFHHGQSLSLKDNPNLEPVSMTKKSLTRRCQTRARSNVHLGSKDKNSHETFESEDYDEVADLSTQESDPSEIHVVTSSDQSTQTVFSPLVTIKNNEKQFKFYTGFNWTMFKVLQRFFDDEVKLIRRKTGQSKVSLEDQLIITLMRLRRGLLLQDLSYRFDLSLGLVDEIINTWIQHMYDGFSALKRKMMAPRSHHVPLPEAFNNRFLKDCRCIIDCTEMFRQSSENSRQQGHNFSNYKHHSTMKLLIAVSPWGSCMFVSDAFEGSISDKAIVQKSGFLDFLEPGDLVLADRGFNINVECASRGAKLMIPPFLDGRKAFSKEEIHLTKLIAKTRIHVERFNKSLKNWRILSGIISLSMDHSISQICFITSCFVNFESPLVSK